MHRIKFISRALSATPHGQPYTIDDCTFIPDADCVDYDWLVVYDDFPRHTVGRIIEESEALCCPREHTILATAEPPTIKIYPPCYTRQFGHVLTTHLPQYLPHPHRHIAPGVLHWFAGYSWEEVQSEPDYPKSKVFSTVCSSKQQKHTAHYQRYQLTSYIAKHIPEMEWFGHGVRPLNVKYEALSDYKYHLAMENYLAPYHWTDKISDPILGLCLTFYAGDPKLAEVLPEGCFIPIPADDPAEATRIIREAIDNNEYEKRLPAIREARHLIASRYNFHKLVIACIHEAEAAERENGTVPSAAPMVLKGRHRLRRNPLHLLSTLLFRLKLLLKG